MPGAGRLSAADVDSAYQAAQRVVDVHKRLVDWLRHGQTLAQIDSFVAQSLADMGAKSCFLGYKVGRSPAFTAHACLSVNDCVVHGRPGDYIHPMKHGDVLKIDIGVTYRGWIGDAAWTYVFGEKSDVVRKLTDCGRESLKRGVKELHPKNTYLAWAKTVQHHVETECGFHLVRGLGGHGIGRKLHGPPFVSNVVPTYWEEWPDAQARCEPGTLLAVEPMIAIGTGKTHQPKNDWPVYTADGTLAVHYEHDILITDDGPRVLTEGLDELPDVVTR